MTVTELVEILQECIGLADVSISVGTWDSNGDSYNESALCHEVRISVVDGETSVCLFGERNDE